MTDELDKVLKVIGNPDSTIADVTKVVIEHFEALHRDPDTAAFGKIFDAFVPRWSISSYEKMLRAAWKAEESRGVEHTETTQ